MSSDYVPTRLAHRARPRCTDCYGRLDWYSAGGALDELGEEEVNELLDQVAAFESDGDTMEFWKCPRCGAGGVLMNWEP